MSLSSHARPCRRDGSGGWCRRHPARALAAASAAVGSLLLVGLVTSLVFLGELNEKESQTRAAWEKAGEARRRAEGIAIVALMGWGQAGDRARSKEAGCGGRHVKPVSLPDLQSVLGQPA
jgi:hypothetical protein